MKVILIENCEIDGAVHFAGEKLDVDHVVGVDLLVQRLAHEPPILELDPPKPEEGK